MKKNYRQLKCNSGEDFKVSWTKVAKVQVLEIMNYSRKVLTLFQPVGHIKKKQKKQNN